MELSHCSTGSFLLVFEGFPNPNWIFKIRFNHRGEYIAEQTMSGKKLIKILTLQVEMAISALFVGPIDFSYKPIGMPPIPFWGLKTAKKGVSIAFLLLAVTISRS